MLLDHVSAGILGRILALKGFSSFAMEDMMEFFQLHPWLCSLYLIFRIIGRISFPIFIFLLVEGFLYTKNKLNYAFRLFLFAVISEIPFDLVFCGKFIEMGYQNVFCTLFLGLILLILVEKMEAYFQHRVLLRNISVIFLSIVFMKLADFFMTDYGGVGVLSIIVMYWFRKNRVEQIVMGCFVLTFSSMLELSALACLPLIRRYNGTRGMNIKYVFYAFYPAHLILIYLLCYIFGIVDAFQGFW